MSWTGLYKACMCLAAFARRVSRLTAPIHPLFQFLIRLRHFPTLPDLSTMSSIPPSSLINQSTAYVALSCLPATYKTSCLSSKMISEREVSLFPEALFSFESGPVSENRANYHRNIYIRCQKVTVQVMLSVEEFHVSHWICVSWIRLEYIYRSSFDINVTIPRNEQFDSDAVVTGCAGVVDEFVTPMDKSGIDGKAPDGTFLGKVRRTNEVVAGTWHETLCAQDRNWETDSLLPAIKSLVDWLLLQDLTEVWS